MNNSTTDLTQRTFINAASSILQNVVVMVVGLIVTPILVSTLGAGRFGAWKICQRYFTITSAVDGRATQALKWTLANKQSSNDEVAKRRDVGCAITIWSCFLPILLAIGGTIAWFSPNLIHDLGVELSQLVRATCGILLLRQLFIPLGGIPEACLIGSNQPYWCSWMIAVSTLLESILLVGAAWIGWGLEGLATATLFGGLFYAILIFRVARRRLPWLGVARPDRAALKTFFSFSFWVFLWTFINKSILLSDILILGLVSSTSRVSQYFLTYFVMSMAIEIAAVLVSAGIPGLGGIVGSGDLNRAAGVRSEMMMVTWLVGTIVGSMILLWNHSFVELWAGPNIFLGATENLLLVLAMVQLIFIRTDAFIIDVTLKIRNKVLIGAGSGITAIGLGYCFARFWRQDVVGLIIGLVAGRAILSIIYPRLVGKALNTRSPQGHAWLFRPLIVMGLLFVVCFSISLYVRAGGWFSLVVYGIFSLGFIIALAFMVGLTQHQRASINIRVNSLLSAYSRQGEK